MLAVGVSRAQAAEDTEPPVLESLSISPATVNTTSSAQTVTVTAHITDNQSGVQYADIGIFSPGHHQIEPGFHLISGTDTDGMYESTLTLPQGSEVGAWKARVRLSDYDGNATELDSEELEADGFPNTVEVEDSAGDSDALARPAVAQERPAAAQEPQIVAQGQNAAPFAGAAIARDTLLASPSGTVSIDVSAPAGENCTGTVTLRTLTAVGANTARRSSRKHKSASVILAGRFVHGAQRQPHDREAAPVDEGPRATRAETCAARASNDRRARFHRCHPHDPHDRDASPAQAATTLTSITSKARPESLTKETRKARLLLRISKPASSF